MSEAFRSMHGVTKVLAAGETKSSVRLESGVQVDMRVVDEDAFGAAHLYFTGSKEHNVKLRERAIRYKYKLNEYGLFPAEGGDAAPPLAAGDEAGIYKALDLPWIPPELREDQGELDLKETPRLIELDDIKAELHAHTIASDGRMTIDELADAAAARGFHTVAVTDHSVSSALAGGLTPERLLRHIDAVREAAERHKKITLLVGSEVDIHPDGRLDYDDDLLAKLDVVIASPHASLRQDPETATRRLVAAVSHPLVHVLGHATGRMINQREGLSPDMAAVIAAAVEHGTALEINAQTMRLDLRDVHVRAAVAAGALLAINTDAHRPEHFDMLRYGILTARRGGLVASQCINAWPKVKLHKWLKARHRAT
jgi:DNA polymerase (family 10)